MEGIEMNYKDNDLYRAYRLKLQYLQTLLAGKAGHAISKLGMFAEDAFSEQQEAIDRLERENADLIALIMTSNAREHYTAIQVAKQVAKDLK